MGILRKITAFFFPERCPFCVRHIGPEDIACEKCLELIGDKQRPILRGAMGYRCVSSFVYGGRVRRALIRVKFYGHTQHIRQLAAILAGDIRRCYEEYHFDLITCVPMHPKDQRTRGFNQSELLCRELSRLLDIPFAQKLKKVKRTKKQHTLSYQERRKNLSGAFELIDREAVRGRSILIVDDIVTSGCTLGTCCKKLNQAKPALICCAAIADANVQHSEDAVI